MSNQQFFFDVLERRSKRLAHIVEISAPPQLITSEIVLVIQAAMGYCPEATKQSLLDWLMGNQCLANDETIKFTDQYEYEKS